MQDNICSWSLYGPISPVFWRCRVHPSRSCWRRWCQSQYNNVRELQLKCTFISQGNTIFCTLDGELKVILSTELCPLPWLMPWTYWRHHRQLGLHRLGCCLWTLLQWWWTQHSLPYLFNTQVQQNLNTWSFKNFTRMSTSYKRPTHSVR